MKRYVLLAVSCLLLVALAGCGSGKVPEALDSNSEGICEPQFPQNQRLKLTAVPGDKNGVFVTQNDGYSDMLGYNGIFDLQIQLDGDQEPLKAALSEGRTTIDELVAFAQIDAKNGLCTMNYDSRCGFARYEYHYEDFILYATYDVFESPSGNLYHKQSVVIESSDFEHPDSEIRFPAFIMEDGKQVDVARENWGVEFEVLDAGPTQLNMKCIQSGGQHLGQLHMEYCDIRGDNLPNGSPNFTVDIFLENDGSTEFTVPFPRGFGELPAGDYEFDFMLRDIFDKAPELVRDYTDQQWYSVEFSVS